MSKSEKYGLIGILVLLVVAIVVSGIISVKNDSEEISNDGDEIYNNAQVESAAVKENEKGDFIQIDINQYLEMYNGSEKQIILIARPTCHYCQIAEPILQNLIYEYKLNINYLNTDNFEENDQQTLINSDEKFSNGLGTPTLVVVGEGQIYDAVDGLTDKAHYKEFFKKNGYIK